MEFNFAILDCNSEIDALWLSIIVSSLNFKADSFTTSCSNSDNLVELDLILICDSSFSFSAFDSLSFASLSWSESNFILLSISDFLDAAIDCSVSILFLSESITSKSSLILFFFTLVSFIDSWQCEIFDLISCPVWLITSISFWISGILISICCRRLFDATIALLSISYCSIAALNSESIAALAWL